MKTIVRDTKGNQYVLQMFVVGDDYLIPYDGNKYWEHHFILRSTWLPMSGLNHDNFDLTKAEYRTLKSISVESNSRVLEKFHNSF
jgi:hypothetical protein